MRQIILIAVLLSAMSSWAAPSHAQRPITIGLAGGASMPNGPFGSSVNTGWHALATVVAGLPMLPLGLRADAAYNQFGFEGGSGSGLAGARQSVTSATLNLTYRLPMTNSPLSPYIITGLGGYHAACGGATCTSSTRFGWNAGLGTKVMVLGLRTFVEGRYHSADRPDGDETYFPITFGVMF